MKVMDDSGLQHQVDIIKSLFDDNDAALQDINEDIDDLQTALDGKASTVHQHASSDVTVMTGYTKPSSTSAIAATDSLNVATGKLEKALDTKAPKASPALTGLPTAPTAPAGTNTTQLATTAFVKREISNQMSLNADMLQTIEDLQNALDGDNNLVSTLTTEIGKKLDKVSNEYVKQLSISGRNLTVTNGDNSSYVLQTQDTTYPSMTAAQATAGSSTTPMVVTPQVLSNLVESKVGSLSTGVSSVTTGSTNGTISVNGSDVPVAGLGSAAYANTSSFATSSHNHDTRYLSLVQATGTLIPANTDLNDLNTAGTYYCDGSTNAKTYANCPYTTSNFKLAVMFHGSNKYGLQILYGYNDESIYVRRMNNGTWASTWRKVLYDNSSLDATKLTGAIDATKLSGTIPSACYTNTDTKVTSTATAPSSSATWYPICSTSSSTATGTTVKNADVRFVMLEGTASTDGYARLYLGDTTATGTAGNTTGGLLLYNNQGKYSAIYGHAGDTTNRTIYMPKSGGTLVAHTTDTAIGSTSVPVYITANGVATAITSLDATKLSGSIPAGCYTNTTYSTFVKSGSSAAAGLVPKPSTTAGTTKYLCEDGTWKVPPDTNTVYTHPTTSGNKHIPSGGSSGQILRWSSDGTAVWGADNNTTYSAFVKSGSTAAAGLVPKPSTTAGTTKYLCEDGTWKVPPDTNTVYTHPTTSGNKHIPSGGSSGQILRWSADGTAAWGADNNTTYSAGTAALLTSGTDTTNRVWTAKMIADYVNSVAGITTSASANGYMKLPNGIIVQWGNVARGNTNGIGGVTSVTYPTPFTSAVYSVQITGYNWEYNSEASAYYTNTATRVTNASTSGNPQIYDKLTGLQFYLGSNVPRAYWVAIGK